MKRYASMDLGINNLVVLSSNVFSPVIINGKPLKSILQFYKKQSVNLKSKLPEGQNSSKRLVNTKNKKENKINDYLEKTSNFISKKMTEENINVLVIGYIDDWFDLKVEDKVRITEYFVDLITLINKKCSKNNVKVKLQEESYTSKNSFLDNEDVIYHKKYKGERVQRGKFESKNKDIINSDLNGSLNILKKYLLRNDEWDDEIFNQLIKSNMNVKIEKIRSFE